VAIGGVIRYRSGVRPLVPPRLLDYSDLLPALRLDSRDFR